MRVLFLTHRVPYAPNRGDRVRAFHLVRALAPLVDLEVVSLAHDADELAQVERVREMGVRATAVRVPRLRNHVRAVLQLAGPRPLTHLLLDAPALGPVLADLVATRPPDVVLAFCTSMARFALQHPLSRFPLVIDFIDADSEKWKALADTTTSPLKRWVYRREARVLAAFERRAATAARTSVAVNEREVRAIRALAPAADVRVLANGVEAAPAAHHASGVTASVAFCGVMNYAPNVEGVVWFAREVWPMVRAERPDARFVVVGSDPTTEVRRLASASLGIQVTGTVPEVASHLARCAVAVAPLKTSRGVQNKVLEAIGLGLPVVVTSAVAEGLPATVLPACRVTDTAEDFARATLTLLGLSAHDRRALASAADLHTLSWTRQLAPIHDILSAAAIRT